MSNIKLLFCGDFAPNTVIDEYEPNSEFLSSVDKYISSHDLAFLNLEAPFTDEINKLEKNGPNLKVNKEFLKPLISSGFNLFGLANNHIMDYGNTGLADTIELLRLNNVNYTGAGIDLDDASKIYYFNKNDITIAIIAVAEKEFSIATSNQAGTAPLDICHNYYQIKEAKEKADIVIMTMHAGNEHFPLPRPNLRKLCHLYIDLGVDLIVNHHTHISSAYEEYKNKKIYYGLGNFVFNLPAKDESWNKGYMVSVDIEIAGENELTLKSDIVPYEQSVNLNSIEILRGACKSDFMDELRRLNSLLFLEEEYEKKWMFFCESKRKHYFLSTFFPFTFKGVGVLEKIFGISNLIMNKKTFPVKLNMLECESHKEVLVELLKKGNRN